MSYAAVAASGPQQTDEEKRAHEVPHLSHDDQTTSTSSLVDVDSPHISSVPSDYQTQEIKTETQADRISQETSSAARQEAHKTEAKPEVKTEARAEAKADEAKKRAASKAKEVKKDVKVNARKFDENKDNPVFIGNYVLWGITAAALGYGAYQKHSEGKLDVNVVGTVALGLGALGAADYFVSRWLVENKYPTK